MSSLRIQRVRELLKRELGDVIRREIPVAEAGLVTVNEVTMSSDLRSATAFVGIMGNAVQQKRGFALLNAERKRLRGLLGKAVILKYTPNLRFVLDDSIVHGNRVLQILEELGPETPAAPPSPDSDPADDEEASEDH